MFDKYYIYIFELEIYVVTYIFQRVFNIIENLKV